MKSNSLKRILAFLVVLCMTFSLAVIASAAEGDPSASLALDVSRSGNTVTAVVSLKETNIGLGGIDFKLSFDNSKLTYITASAGSIFGFDFADDDKANSKGYVYAVGNVDSGDTMKAGVLATFTFAIKDDVTDKASIGLISGNGSDKNSKTFVLTLPDSKTFDVAAYNQFDIDSANMTLGNNLAINFYVDPAYLDSNEDYFAHITKTYADGRPDVEVIVEDDNWKVDSRDGFFYFTLEKVAAKEMADNIYVVVYRDEDVDIAVSNLKKESVRAYAERALKKEEGKSSPEADKLALYVDLLNYGAEAQNYFNYNESDLANKNLTAAQKAYGQNSVTMKDESEKGIGYAGMDLVLESSIIVDFYFTSIPNNHNDMYAIATYTDHYGSAKKIRVEGEAFLQDPDDGCWYVPVKGLVVADCMQMVTIQVYDVNGAVVGSAKDSVESYTARLANADPLYVAIMKFAVSAYNSFH